MKKMRAPMLFAAGLATAALCASFPAAHRPARAQAFSVTSEPAVLSRVGAPAIGALQWRGGLRLSSPGPHFGGFSGLVLGKDGRELLAVSDRGWWWRATLAYDEKGFLSGIRRAGGMAPILDSRGRRLKGSWRDAESLAPYDSRRLSGPVLAGFERKERLALYRWSARGEKARARYIALPLGVSEGKNNGEMEAAARFWSGPRKGWFIAAGEKTFDENGNVRAWLWKNRRITAFSIARRGLFRITDIAVLPDGTGFLTLERRFSKKMKALPAFAIRLFRTRAIARGETLSGTLLVEAAWPLFAIDNMEGLAIHRHANGELRATIISDDNFNPGLQSTLMFQFALPRKVLNKLKE